MPGEGRPPCAWNMLRISAVASTGAGSDTAPPAGGWHAWRSRGLAHEEAALRPRLHQAARLQQVVGADHGGRAHAVAARAIAHGRQLAARPQQALFDALGKAGGQLFGQARRVLRLRLCGEHGQHSLCSVWQSVL